MAKQLPAGAAGARGLALRKLVARLAGARLCFGEPVRVGDRAVVPVARVHASGGGGWGAGDDRGDRAGGGGSLSASPVGFIDIGPEGARFEAIPDPDLAPKLIRASAAAAVTLLTAAAVRRGALGRGGRQVRALLRR